MNKIWNIISGVILIIIGIFFMTNKIGAVVTISLWIGIGFIVKGITTFFEFVQNKSGGSRVLHLVSAIIDIFVGIIFFNKPIMTATIIPVIMAFWVLMFGAIQIAQALNLKKGGAHWFFALIMGIVSIIASFFMITNPIASTIATVAMIGIIMIFNGIILTIKSFIK